MNALRIKTLQISREKSNTMRSIYLLRIAVFLTVMTNRVCYHHQSFWSYFIRLHSNGSWYVVNLANLSQGLLCREINFSMLKVDLMFKILIFHIVLLLITGVCFSCKLGVFCLSLSQILEINVHCRFELLVLML